MTNQVERMAAMAAKDRLNTALGRISELERKIERMAASDQTKVGPTGWAHNSKEELKLIWDDLTAVNEWLYALSVKDPS